MGLEIPGKTLLERKPKNSFYEPDNTFPLLKMNADIGIEAISEF